MPWRTTPREPYPSLVSEVMLQQTQASRVAQRLPPFLERFPSLEALAGASVDEVLAAWDGLGYYRRARLLHAAAGAIVRQHAGRVPADVGVLRTLPGIGDYTAGAIASMVFNLATPAVDGNVARVLARVGGVRAAHNSREILAAARDRVRRLLPHARPAALNEALMELGATVCTPRSPRCGACPIRGMCEARARGQEETIPLPRAAPARRVLRLHCVVVRCGAGVLVEQRGDSGLWHGLWQAPTLEASRATREDLSAWLGHPVSMLVERFTHTTTHRDVRFRVWRAETPRGARARALARRGRRWVDALDAIALPAPQRRILERELG